MSTRRTRKSLASEVLESVEKAGIGCLFCRTLLPNQSPAVSESDDSVQELDSKFEILCYHLKVSPDPESQLNFRQEPFPFCSTCSEKVENVYELHRNIEEIQEKIESIIQAVAASVIDGKQAENGNSHDSKNKEEPVESQLFESKLDRIRNLVVAKYSPESSLKRCPDKSAKIKPAAKRFKTDTPDAQEENATELQDVNQDLHIQGITVSHHEPQTQTIIEYIEAQPGESSMDDTGLDGGTYVYQIVVPSAEHGNMVIQQENGTENVQFIQEGVEVLEGMDMNVVEEIVYTNDTSVHWNSVRGKKRNPDIPLNRTVEIEANKFLYGNKYYFEKLDDGSWKCGECEIVKENKAKIIRHVSNKHEFADRYCCEFCGRTFPTEDYLLKHKLSHPEYGNGGPVMCDKCGKKFNSRRHMIYRHKCPQRDKDAPLVVDYPCEFCELRFRYDSLLQEHIKSKHTSPEYKCTTCGKVFENLADLAKHKLTHAKVNPYLCDYCSESFSTRLLLQGHVLRTHKASPAQSATSEDRPFQCSICLACFARPTGLTAHFKSVHEDERPHECEQCHSRFKTKSSLRQHMQNIHAKPKAAQDTQRPFGCELCTKSFRQQKNLKDHMKTHSDDKPFACDLCGYRCRKSSNLKSHVSYVHRGNARRKNLNEGEEITVEFKAEDIVTVGDSSIRQETDGNSDFTHEPECSSLGESSEDAKVAAPGSVQHV